MNEQTRYKIEDNAISIARYLDLDPEEQNWLYPLLSKSVQSAISVAEAIGKTPKSYVEIADEVELNSNTVKQLIYALSSPLGIESTETEKVYRIVGGRSRKKLKKRHENLK